MRPVTNLDRKGRHKKSIWYEDTAHEEEDIWRKPDGSPVPSRYGPYREYIANCTSVEFADLIVALWNQQP